MVSSKVLLLWGALLPTTGMGFVLPTNLIHAKKHCEGKTVSAGSGSLEDENIDSTTCNDGEQPWDAGSRRGFLTAGSRAAVATPSLLNVWPTTPPPAHAAAAAASSKSSSDRPRIVLWGFGNQNKLMARYLYERKWPVVGVVSHYDIGADYGQIDLDAWGPALGVKTGVKIVDEEGAPAMLEKVKPDLCILCTRSTLEELKPALTVCAENKVNVATIAEELLFSAGSSPDLTREMDLLFKKKGVTFSGSGMLDGSLGELPLVLGSMMQRIDGSKGGFSYNVDDYGEVVSQSVGVGLTKAEFQKEIVERPQAKSYVYNSNEWLATAMGFTILETTEKREPTTATNALKSKSLGKVIPVGDCTGMKVICTTTTKEGVTFITEQIGKLYDKSQGEVDFVEWSFEGEPSGVSFTMKSPPTPEMTNTALISRISQIIEAPPGYVTSDRFEIARYQNWR